LSKEIDTPPRQIEKVVTLRFFPPGPVA